MGFLLLFYLFIIYLFFFIDFFFFFLNLTFFSFIVFILSPYCKIMTTFNYKLLYYYSLHYKLLPFKECSMKVSYIHQLIKFIFIIDIIQDVSVIVSLLSKSFSQCNNQLKRILSFRIKKERQFTIKRFDVLQQQQQQKSLS